MPAYVAKFDDIYTTLAVLDVGDERLPPTKQPRQVGLSQSLLLPDLTEEGPQPFLFIAVKGFVHAPRIGTPDKYLKSRYGMMRGNTCGNQRGHRLRSQC